MNLLLDNKIILNFKNKTIINNDTHVLLLSIYCILSLIICLYFQSLNGLLICFITLLLTIKIKDIQINIFIILQLIILAVYLLYQTTFSNTLFARDDDRVYVQLALYSHDSFSPFDIFLRGKELRYPNESYIFKDIFFLNYGYDLILGIITRYLFIFKPTIYDYFFINVIPTIFILIFIKNISENYFNKKVSRIAITITSIYPSILIHSVIVLKDIWVSFAFIWFICSFFDSKYINSLISLLLNILLRYRMFMILAIISVVTAIFNLKKQKSILIFIGISIICLIIIHPQFLHINFGQSTDVIKRYDYQSGLTASIHRASPLLQYIGFFINWFFVHFPPIEFFTKGFNIYSLFCDISTFYWTALIPFLITGVIYTLLEVKDKRLLVSFTIITFSMIFSGYLDIRWRLISDVLAIPFISAGIIEAKRYKTTIIVSYNILIFILSFYMILKLNQLIS